MSWKAIGKSVIGTSHSSANKLCEDALAYNCVTDKAGNEVMIVCVSDGAGSAQYAKEAAELVTTRTIELLTQVLQNNKDLNEAAILLIAETIYDELLQLSIVANVALNEYSCTFLGCVLMNESALFFQIGDGVIIREDGNDGYTTVWWPHNGEYINSTSFLTDDSNFSNLKIVYLDEAINEVALLTDGLQQLVLNNENLTVHQPFFSGLFKWLRQVSNKEEVAILDKKLADYLAGENINSRTDDDKTLLLATRKTVS